MLGVVGAVGAGVWGGTRMFLGARHGVIEDVSGGGGGDGVMMAGDPLIGTVGMTAPLPSVGQAAPAGGGVTPPPAQLPPVVLEMGRRQELEPAPADPVRTQPAAQPVVERPVSAPQQAQPQPVQQQPAQQQPGPQQQQPAPATTPGVTYGTLPADAAEAVAAAERAIRENKLVEARILLNRALANPRAAERDKANLRRRIQELNETLIFSPRIFTGDPFTDTYTVQRGDSLARITSRMGLGVDWRLVQRVNRLSSPNRIQVGQKLKVVRGPFHAVVSKSGFRMDIYAGDPIASSAGAARPGRPDGAEKDWVYIRSFSVGLGEQGSTPLGTFVVRPNSKLINPFWRNPRTGEEFAADDPKNPIGEHWLGLDGLDENTKQYQGYGVHGTIDPGSIGREMSMGCVRLAAEDIALVYELLEEGVSVVRIVP